LNIKQSLFNSHRTEQSYSFVNLIIETRFSRQKKAYVNIIQ